ncbi:MAG: Ig domain-containing protein [Woeseiaceae bacterium]|nr:Ig domain-containing protein [Woeseiaceae bacterium]
MTRQYFAAAAAILLGACSSSDAPNQAPVVGAIADQAISANKASAPIPFTVSDESAGSLSLSAVTENPDVIPEDGLSLGGAGTNRTLTVTPVPDTTGDSFITVIATDPAGLASSTSFLLTVEAEQRSLQAFTRDEFAVDADDGEPVLVNAIEFQQDADNDDFADLLAQ